jgi:aryl-alcohol dehydrogenase-like predicted oxidoreductase
MSRLQGYRTRYESSQAPRAVDEYIKIAAKYGVTPAQLALGFVQSRPFVPSTIIGATSVDQLEVRLVTYPPTQKLVERTAHASLPA